MKQGNRKVDEQARETIASILLFDVSDPRLDLVTITGCKVSYDRAYCDVFYTVDPERYESTARSARGIQGAYKVGDGEEAALAEGTPAQVPSRRDGRRRRKDGPRARA